MNSPDKIRLLKIRAGKFLRINIPLAILLAFVMVLPDHLMTVFTDKNHVIYEYWIYLLLFGFCSLLLLSRRVVFIITILVLICVIEIAHFSYMAYFGGVISASAILQFFIEYQDVFSASLGYSHFLYFAPLIVLVPYSIAMVAVWKSRYTRITAPYAWLATLAIMLLVPFNIIARPEQVVKYYPQTEFPSFANSYLNLSVLFFNHIPRLAFPGVYASGTTTADISPVDIIRHEIPGQMTIVVIMTESVTYDHMGLFGYSRDTTPFLSSMQHSDGFVWKEGIAAGISTRVSFSSFWNAVRDPHDTQRFIRKNTNLFRLARQNGFYSQFYSAQGSNLIRDSGIEYMNIIYTDALFPGVDNRSSDDALVEMARRLELHDKNLIVFHTRTAHAPYNSNYSEHPGFSIYPEDDSDFRRLLVNTYDNAIVYTDSIIHQLVDIMTDRVNGPLYFLITSDHGQLFGDDSAKTYGHGKLVPEVGHVPVIFYNVNGDRQWIEREQALEVPTHYEVCRLLLSMLGFEIIEGDGDDQMYYINGLGYHHGENGYILVDKSRMKSEKNMKGITYHVYPAS